MIRISGFEKEKLLSFSLTKKINSHSECSFSFNIGSKDCSEYMKKMNRNISIDNGRKYIFYGYINSVKAEQHYFDTVVTVFAVSYSMMMDISPKKRIFQNPQKTLASVCETVGKDYNSKISCTNPAGISKPLIQDNETDFSFLVHTSGAERFCVFVDDTKDISVPCVNIVRDISRNTVFYENTADKVTVYSSGIFEVQLHDEVFEIGTRVNFKFGEGIIAEVRAFLGRGILVYNYVIYPEKMLPTAVSRQNVGNIRLKGFVEDSSDPENKGRIKVRMECDYTDPEPDKMMWIPYRTPYISQNGGIIFVPDKGDKVEVIYCRNEMYACECLGDTELSRFGDVKNKYISDINGHIVIFSEESFEIRSGDNIYIRLNNDEIRLNAGKSSVSVSDGKLELKFGGTSVCINDNIEIKTAKTNTVCSSAVIDSKGNVDIKGTFIHLK